MKTLILSVLFLLSLSATASEVVLPMNRAFESLKVLLPFMTNEAKFKEKANQTKIAESLAGLESAFREVKHSSVIKEDIFAPSLEIVREEIRSTQEAFKGGNKEYARWQLQQITSTCLACHSRLPESHASSFREMSRFIDPKQFRGPYELGRAYVLVRMYPEAKEKFTLAIDEALIRKELSALVNPMKQILYIKTKIQRDPQQMITFLDHYLKKPLQAEMKTQLTDWHARLKLWSKAPRQEFKSITNGKDFERFTKLVLSPLFEDKNIYLGKKDVDLLMASGLISNFLFENPRTEVAADALYWLGRVEKYLGRDDFHATGDHYLKLCLDKYPRSKVARACLDEYEESVNFNFSGSSGTDIPDDVAADLRRYKALLKNK